MKRQFLKIIIPAAGYGKRMGVVPAKELLPHPDSGKPFLLEAIERHLSLQAPFHIISRFDKTELNEYVEDLKNSRPNLSLNLQLIDPSKEWPDTVLKSKDHWFDWNLLLLPDTDYKPFITFKQIEELVAIKDMTVNFFTFKVEDSSLWGIVKVSLDCFEIVEKPKKHNDKQESRAWGLILFHKNIGEALFKSLLESSTDHQWKKIKNRAHVVPLDFFADLTRTK